MGAIRQLGVTAHKVAFATPLTARAYVATWGALRQLPIPAGAAARIANAASAAAKGRDDVFGLAKPRTVVTGAGPVRLLLRPQDFGFRPLVSRSLGYEEEVFRLLKERLHRYDAVIEIGANIGVFTTAIGLLARAAGRDVSRVVAFEPARGAFARLRQNLELNGLGGVTTIEAAVSDQDGTAAFFESSPMATTNSLHQGFASMRGGSVGETVVRTIDAARLGEFVPGAERVLLKIDAEGHEGAILARLDAFVRERRPDLIVEVLRRYAEGVAAIVKKWGYRCFRIRPGGLSNEPLSNADHHSRDWLLTPA